MKRINCRRCQYCFVTLEADKPHGFKSPQIPSLVVFQSSGSPCSMFTQKPLAK